MELELKNLTKRFRDMTAVDHVTYTMTNGVYGLLGVNGAGKTTLMKLIPGLRKAAVFLSITGLILRIM